MKKLMSKLVAFALVATLAFALTGCFVTPNTSITFNKYPYGTYAEGTSVETALSAIEVTLTENGEVVKSGTLLALRDEGLVVVEGFNLAEKGNNKTAKIVFGTAVVTFNYSVVGTISEDGSIALGETSVIGNVYSENGVYVSETGDHIVELNGNTISVADYVGSWVAGGNLTVSNGIIDARESSRTIGVYADEGGAVTLTNIQLLTAGATNPIQCYGGSMILNNVTAVQSGFSATPWYNSAIQVVNNITYPEKDPVTNKHVIYGENANLTVNGGMYSGDKAIQISAPGGNVTINGGTFIGATWVINGDFAPNNYTHTEGKTYESVITINGGEFTGKIKTSVATVLVINGGTFSFDLSAINTKEIQGTVQINGTVVDNGNGTWTVVPATPAE